MDGKHLENAPDLTVTVPEKQSDCSSSESGGKSSTQFKPAVSKSGIIFGLLATFISGSNALLVKVVEIHAVEMTLFRLCVQFLVTLPIMFYKRETVDILGPEHLRKALWIRGLSGSLNLIFLYLAVSSLPLGDGVTITYLSIVLVPFASRLFLKESLTIMDVVFAVISLSGVILIARPTFLFPSETDTQNSTSSIGIVYGLISSLLRAVSVISLRKVGPSTFPFLNMMYYCAFGCVISSCILWAIQAFQYPCQHSLPFIFTIGILGIIGQFFLTMSSKTERAGTVGILKASQIIFVYLMQVVILKDTPNLLSVIGATLVLSSSVGIGLRKILKEKRNSKKK